MACLRGREGQQPGGIVQEHDGLGGSLQRERLRLIVARARQRGVRVAGGVVEFAQLEAHLEHALQRQVDRGLVQKLAPVRRRGPGPPRTEDVSFF